MSRKKLQVSRIRSKGGMSGEYLEKIVKACERESAPLTEDLVALIVSRQIMESGQKQLFRKVFHNISIKRKWSFNFWFAPDADLLEVRENGLIIGYELKGVKAKKNEYELPAIYEGLDEALAYLINPTIIQDDEKIVSSSVFDYVYLVHAGNEPNGAMCKVIDQCTPIGYMLVDYKGAREIVKPKKNPFVDQAIKQMFLKNLGVLNPYRLGTNVSLPKGMLI